MTRVEFRLGRVPLVALGCLLVSACGLFGRDDKRPEYYSAVEAPELQIPAGLDRPSAATALVIVTPQSPLPERQPVVMPPRVESESATRDENSRIRWSGEGAYLLVDDTPASVQRRLGYAIERAGMAVRETGIEDTFEFEYWHTVSDGDSGWFSWLAFWRDDAPNYSGVYRVVTAPDGEQTRVYLQTVEGSPAAADAAEHLLILIRQRLG